MKHAIENMRTLPLFVIFLLASGTIALAGQHGSPPNGYYPNGFTGAAFSGTVSAVDDAGGTIVLTYADNKTGKSETLKCDFIDNYTIRFRDGSMHKLKPSLIPVGTHLTVYYMTHNKKLHGKKISVNTIAGIKGAPDQAKRWRNFMAFQ